MGGLYIIYISAGNDPISHFTVFFGACSNIALPCLPHDLADLLGVVRHEHVDAAEVSRIVAG